jgi:phage terminase large subunit-like protein
VVTNCTDKLRWERLWGRGNIPRQIWYFYPDGLTLEKEFDTKWVPEILPKGRYERDPQYGWRLTRRNGKPNSLVFLAGPTVYFQTYSKSVSNVQAGSVHELYCDEEMPLDFYDELMFRLTATAGIFTSGFTPTLNQLFWKQAMEGNKVLPQALKMTVSMYDCLKYEDGSPSRMMTMEKIQEAISKCKNETEVQRRVFGKFVTEEGRSYYAFDFDKNVVKPYSTKGWYIYAAIDYGSGNDGKEKKNHPAAIVFIAVRPDYKKAAVVKSWRGDGEVTTAGDVFNKFIELEDEYNFKVTLACYDPASADLGTIAERNNRSFQKADKTRDAGEDLLNTLFKFRMLDIFDDCPDNLKLAGELMHLMKVKQSSDNKRDDDLSDATRYDVMQIPWDLEAVNEKVREEIEGKTEIRTRPLTEAEVMEDQIRMRRGLDDRHTSSDEAGWTDFDQEIDYWNHEYGEN